MFFKSDDETFKGQVSGKERSIFPLLFMGTFRSLIKVGRKNSEDDYRPRARELATGTGPPPRVETLKFDRRRDEGALTLSVLLIRRTVRGLLPLRHSPSSTLNE